MKNKKGTVLHWIVFLILGAFGLFFVLTASIEIKGLDGNWQLNLLDNYLEAEKDLLKIDQAAKYAGWQSVLELGEKGGFIEKSDCGALGNYNFWNKLAEWNKCLPEIEEAVSIKVKEKIAN